MLIIEGEILVALDIQALLAEGERAPWPSRPTIWRPYEARRCRAAFISWDVRLDGGHGSTPVASHREPGLAATPHAAYGRRLAFLFGSGSSAAEMRNNSLSQAPSSQRSGSTLMHGLAPG